MKIAVLGTGGVGGYYGARLAAAGNDVTFIARGAHLAALRSEGLRLESPLGDLHLQPLQATDDPAAVGPVGLLLVTVKTYQLDAAIAAMAPLLDAGTTVLPLLNGVDISERIAATIGPERVLVGLCGLSSAVAAPGVIRHVTPGEFVRLGEPDGSLTPRAEAIAALLQAAGINALATARIRREQWLKFLVLAPFAGVCSLTRHTKQAVWDDPDTRALLEAAVREVEALSRARGVDWGDDDPTTRTLERIAAMPPHMQPSMALDLQRGRPLELEAITGAVVRMGAETGVDVPVNRCIYAALKLHADGTAAG